LSNLLVALGVLLSLDIDAEAAGRALGSYGAPGRLERVSRDEPFTVLVDYAHTPDALARVLASLGPLTAGRLICVFGCGGDRDAAKRPLMGRAVRDGADIGIVTSDNPRTEAPDAIIEMILPGIDGGGLPRLTADEIASARRGYTVDSDRRRAVALAIRIAEPGDTVLIAGKGHEDYQILGTKRIHFDDREEARGALARRKGEADG
jgi:UDP-N-acetylmuramoyl-L-alanyl-D-glutamate--2,6-diaminopimelate ligase